MCQDVGIVVEDFGSYRRVLSVPITWNAIFRQPLLGILFVSAIRCASSHLVRNSSILRKRSRLQPLQKTTLRIVPVDSGTSLIEQEHMLKLHLETKAYGDESSAPSGVHCVSCTRNRLCIIPQSIKIK